MYQFCHVNAYARKVSVKSKTDDNWSVQDILDEATRKEGCFSKDIKNPQPPILVYGDPIEKIHETIEDWASNTKDSKKRKTRIDAKCMLAGVFSAEKGTSLEDWEKIKTDAISWAKNKYGERLRTVLEHIDEPHPHCHFYVVPLPGEVFETVHEGLAAKKAAMATGMSKKDANTPYVDAMKAFLDGYHDRVGAPNGMTRIGPGRRRLKQKEWHAEKQQAKAIAAQHNKASRLMNEANATISEAIAKSEDIEGSALQKVEDLKKKAAEFKIKVKAEAQQIKDQAIKDGETILTSAEKSGFERGLDAFGALPWVQKVARLLNKVTKERDTLKVERDQLKESLDKTAVEHETLKAKADGWFESMIELMRIKPKYEKALKDVDELKIKSDRTDELDSELKEAKGRIKILEAIVEALTPEPEPEPEKLQVKVRRQRESDGISLER